MKKLRQNNYFADWGPKDHVGGKKGASISERKRNEKENG